MIDNIIKAERFFAVHTALRLVPPPRNRSVDDLRAHIKDVLFKQRKRKP